MSSSLPSNSAGSRLAVKEICFFSQAGGEEDGAPLDLLVQGVGPLLRDALLGLQLGEQQGAVGQVGQAGGLVQNDLEILVPLLRGGIRLPKELGKALDGGDGGS